MYNGRVHVHDFAEFLTSMANSFVFRGLISSMYALTCWNIAISKNQSVHVWSVSRAQL